MLAVSTGVYSQQINFSMGLATCKPSQELDLKFFVPKLEYQLNKSESYKLSISYLQKGYGTKVVLTDLEGEITGSEIRQTKASYLSVSPKIGKTFEYDDFVLNLFLGAHGDLQVNNTSEYMNKYNVGFDFETSLSYRVDAFMFGVEYSYIYDPFYISDMLELRTNTNLLSLTISYEISKN